MITPFLLSIELIIDDLEMYKDLTHLEQEDQRDRSVLIVFKDRRIVDLLKETLFNIGLNVVPSFCGEAAIAKVKAEKFHCSILEYSLPDIKGDELATQFRREVPNMGLILLTGFKSSISPDKLKVFNYVLEKPANLEVLLSAVKQFY